MQETRDYSEQTFPFVTGPSVRHPPTHLTKYLPRIRPMFLRRSDSHPSTRPTSLSQILCLFGEFLRKFICRPWHEARKQIKAGSHICAQVRSTTLRPLVSTYGKSTDWLDLSASPRKLSIRVYVMRRSSTACLK